MLTLFPDEQIITQSSEGAVTLTTHRICYEYREWGRSYNQNIMLEHITSCENYSSNRYTLLILAGLLLAVAIFSNETEIKAPAVAISLLCAFAYWQTRSNFVIIASPSTKMRIKVTGMRREKVLDFINKIEQTKHKRIVSLSNRPVALT